MTRVLVTDAGRGSGMSVVRALGRRGLDVIAADASRASPAFASRYVAEKVLYPRPEEHGPAAVAAIVDAARTHAADLVIPVGETLVILLSAARKRFAPSVGLALADPEALAVARDKQATVELAARLGVPTPRTSLVESAADAVRAAEAFEWPVVLKPQRSRTVRGGEGDGGVDAFGVQYAASPSELARRMQALEGRCAVLLQEYCAGEGHGIGLLLDRGRPLLGFQYRRLREVPYTGGPSSFRESIPLDPELFEHSVRMLAELAWTGPAMVEWKVGVRGPLLMEINGRLWGSLALAVKAGVDLPGGLVDLYLGGPDGAAGPPDLAYRTGVRARDLGLELTWIASALVREAEYPFLLPPSRREALAAALRLLDPRDGFDLFSRDDPVPGLLELARLGANGPRRLLATLRSRSRPYRAPGAPAAESDVDGGAP